MYICLCREVTDGAIRRAINEQKPSSIKELCSLLKVGMQCGKCMKCVREIFVEEQK